jgi:hypothetical protein
VLSVVDPTAVLEDRDVLDTRIRTAPATFGGEVRTGGSEVDVDGPIRSRPVTPFVDRECRRLGATTQPIIGGPRGDRGLTDRNVCGAGLARPRVPRRCRRGWGA